MGNQKKYDTVWHDSPETIKKFLEQRPDYEQLCAEIAYILRKRIKDADIEISTVSNRAKTLKSFLEKISRKFYKDPFKEITDFAGVRVVYLYQQDLKKIEVIIKKDFTILEKVDKLNEKGIDKFGYGAIHFIVKLGKNSSGARYDDLKNLHCEIQIRTVLQDAWAIIDHHLVYKRESDVPTNLQRKLNSLAGLFETADDQFENIRQEREKYLSELDKSIQSNDFLKNEFNLDTFVAFLKWKFPNSDTENFKGQINIIYEDISQLGFKNLTYIDQVVERYKSQILKLKYSLEDKVPSFKFEKKEWSAVLIVAFLLAIENDKFRQIARIDEITRTILKSFKRKESKVTIETSSDKK